VEVSQDAPEIEQVDHEKRERGDDTDLHGTHCVFNLAVNRNLSVLWASTTG
jgi:hypothetical protein